MLDSDDYKMFKIYAANPSLISWLLSKSSAANILL